MTLALARIAPPTHDAPELRLVPPAPPQERCVYAASTRGRPVALLASAGIVAAITAALALMNASPSPKMRKAPIQVIQMELAPPEAPPPPRASSPDRPPPAPAIVVPVRPMVTPVDPQPIVATTTEAAPPAPPIAPPAEAKSVAGPVGAAPVAAPVPGPSDGGDLSAKMIEAKPPRYPEESRRRREQGTVKLRVLVGIDGRVEQASVDASSGSSRLDDAALSAVRRWRWSPLVRNGVAVMVRGFVTIPFVLRA